MNRTYIHICKYRIHFCLSHGLPQVDMECNESVDKWLNELNSLIKLYIQTQSSNEVVKLYKYTAFETFRNV